MMHAVFISVIVLFSTQSIKKALRKRIAMA